MKKFLIIVSLLSLSAPAFARYKINAITGRLDRVDGSTISSGGNFILNTNTLQSGATFYVSSGTIDTGGLRMAGLLDIDRPTLHGPFDNTARLKFDPSSSGGLIDLYSYNAIAPSVGMRVFGSNEVNVGSLLFTIASGASAGIRVSSCTTCNPQAIYTFSGQTGESNISDNQGNVMFTFNPSSSGIRGQRSWNFYDSDSSNFVGFKASNTVSANAVWVLPPADGTSGQAIITDGNKNLSFGTVASGGSSTSTTNVFQYASTNTKTVGGTTSETSLIGDGIGTLTFPANIFVDGSTFKVEATGLYEQGSSTNFTWKLKLGGVTIAQASGNQIVSGGNWLFNSIVTIRTTGGSGTLSAGSALVDIGNGGSTFQSPSTSTAAINTTVPNTLEFTGQFDTTDSSFTSVNFLVNAFQVSTAPITIAGQPNTLEVFSPVISSSPTYSIFIGNGMTLTVTGATATININYSTVASRGDVLDKEFWWPAAATQPLEAGADNVPPIVSTAGVNMDHLTTDFDSATDECRDVNFGVSTVSLVNVTTVTFTAYSFSASTGSGSFGWYFAHNNGVQGNVSVDPSTSTVASSFVATSATRSNLNTTSWDASLATLGWVGGDWVEGLFCRDANNASDTMSGDLKAIAFSIILKKNR